MPCQAYIEKNFSQSSLAIIGYAREIIDDYTDQGFTLTLRQLYYQFVARGLIANKQTEYKRVGSIINDARLAGHIDWYAIEDRTRNLRGNQHWDSPTDVLNAAAQGFRYDKWEDQSWRVEIWIEKDALVGVIEPACRALDIDYFACRGYSSQSEQWRAAQRFGGYEEAGQRCVLIHLGDHDPSGIDMTRDNQDRLDLFVPATVVVRRLALNFDQIEQYRPPPNPAKLTDSRADGYIRRFGYDSWELDALDPPVIDQMIRNAVLEYRDEDLWEVATEREKEAKGRLSELAATWKD